MQSYKKDINWYLVLGIWVYIVIILRIFFMNKADNIFPDLVRMIDRGAKEKLLKQKC